MRVKCKLSDFPTGSDKRRTVQLAHFFLHQDYDVVPIKLRVEGLPVARFQRLSGGAVFPEQDHAAVLAFHVQFAGGS